MTKLDKLLDKVSKLKITSLTLDMSKKYMDNYIELWSNNTIKESNYLIDLPNWKIYKVL